MFGSSFLVMFMLVSKYADVIPDARHRNASIEFMLVYPDRNGNFIMKKVSCKKC
jgi:hypothetical protein